MSGITSNSSTEDYFFTLFYLILVSQFAGIYVNALFYNTNFVLCTSKYYMCGAATLAKLYTRLCTDLLCNCTQRSPITVKVYLQVYLQVYL